NQDAIRIDAKTKLIAAHHDYAPGFIDDPLEYSRVKSAADFNIETGILRVPYVGKGKKDDQARMLALLQAIYDANRPKVETARDLNETIDSLTRGLADSQRTRDERKKQIDELTAAAQNQPDASE